MQAEVWAAAVPGTLGLRAGDMETFLSRADESMDPARFEAVLGGKSVTAFEDNRYFTYALGEGDLPRLPGVTGEGAAKERGTLFGRVLFLKPGTLVLILAGNANEPQPHYGPPRIKEEELRADFGGDFEFEWLREIRFDTADPGRSGALAWSVLLRRNAASCGRPAGLCADYCSGSNFAPGIFKVKA